MASINWFVVLAISKFLARRPRQRFIQFDNILTSTILTSNKTYVITTGTRRGLIDKIYKKNILVRNEKNDILLKYAKISNIRGCYRNCLTGSSIPSSWEFIYIKFEPDYNLNRYITMDKLINKY